MGSSKRGISKAKQGCSRFKVAYRNNNGPVASSNFELIRFDDKTDEQIINESDYKTNRPIEDLICNPQRTLGRIPRRLNKWIIYRRDKNPEFRGQNLTVSVVTKRIRQMWADEPEDVKEFYAALSRLAEKKHIEKYGADYKYRPGPSKKFKSKQGNEKKLSKLTPPPENLSPNTISSSSPELPSSSPITPLQPFSFLSPVSTTSSNFSSPTESEYLSILESIESMEPMQTFPFLSDITPISPSSMELMQTFPPLSDITSTYKESSSNSNLSTESGELFIDPLESTQASEEQPLCFDESTWSFLSSLGLIESPTIQENDQYLNDSIDLLSLLCQVNCPKENSYNDQPLYPDQLYPHQPILNQIHHPDQTNFDNDMIDFTLYDQIHHPDQTNFDNDMIDFTLYDQMNFDNDMIDFTLYDRQPSL